MNVINTEKAPKAIGPYSQAVEKNGFLFISGQLGVDPDTGILGDTFENQTKLIFSHLGNILSEADMSFDNVLKVTIYLKDLNNFVVMNNIYANFFTPPYPAREAVEVSRLPKDVDIEISLIAAR